MHATISGRPTASLWSLATADLDAVHEGMLDDPRALEYALGQALASVIGAITWSVHRFEPRGMSLVGTGARGRVIAHTWPERASLTLDVYGEAARIDSALADCIDAVSRPR